MFDAGLPAPSREEVRMMEAEASFTVQWCLATACTLYLSPFVIDAVSKIF